MLHCLSIAFENSMVGLYTFQLTAELTVITTVIRSVDFGRSVYCICVNYKNTYLNVYSVFICFCKDFQIAKRLNNNPVEIQFTPCSHP